MNKEEMIEELREIADLAEDGVFKITGFKSEVIPDSTYHTVAIKYHIVDDDE